MDEANSSPPEVRRLWPSDQEAFRDHLLSLDPRSRHLRFGGGMSDDFLVRYSENCFGKGDLVYGAFIAGKLVGAAELRSNQAIWSDQAHSARRHQPRRRNDRDRLPARKCWHAEPGEEV